ncbi:hypothetical protein Pcinc_008993 [Petrolisthes cinctipes]|uniref:Uncharacterized protein n=1 Tax=Petrolisthes cinctipes TaxID=88211 RepID=A0AAE1G7U7_PETCI|nr:hypothetical protein Pcinc_008993 [Petrolisthes cinctipes]
MAQRTTSSSLSKIKNQPDLDLKIHLLLLKCAIYEVPYQPCFISKIFLVPKSKGGNRLIIDLSSLNSHILAPYFHMHNHRSLANSLHPPAWMSTVAMQDACLHVPIRQLFAQVSCFLFRIKTLFLPSPTVRSECGSPHLHSHSKMASFPPTPAGNQCHRLFRRLGHLGHVSRIDSKDCQHSNQPSEQPRFPHQLPKVPHPPFNRRGMARDSLVPPIRTLGASGGQINVHPVIHQACSITKTSLTPAMGTNSRQTQLCHPNTTPQPTTTTTTLAPQNSFKPLAPRRSEATASKLSQTPATVATSQNVVNIPPFPPLRKHDPPLD